MSGRYAEILCNCNDIGKVIIIEIKGVPGIKSGPVSGRISEKCRPDF